MEILQNIVEVLEIQETLQNALVESLQVQDWIEHSSVEELFESLGI